MTLLARGAIVAVLVVTAIALWLRFAPPVPADLAVDLAQPGLAAQPGWASFCPVAGWPGDDGLGADMARVRSAVLAIPRTTEIGAGDGGGPMTFVSRSRIFGVSVYTTVALRETGAAGTAAPHFCLVSRSAVPVLGPIHAARIVRSAIAGIYGDHLPDLPPPVWQPVDG